MHLHLGQLVYTSFAGTGLKILASKQVPQEIQQALLQQIVFKYWDSYKPPETGYRAVYLHQVGPKQTLFGWFYNEEADDVGRAHLPYFLCYYLAEPLLDQLDTIFTCLQKGPVALVDRHSLPSSLEPIAIANLSYRPARPGVAVPERDRQYVRTCLRRKQLFELFAPAEVTEAAVGIFPKYWHKFRKRDRLIEPARVETAASNSEPHLEECATDSTILSSIGYKQRLQKYRKALIEASQRGNSTNVASDRELKRLQRVLKLTAKDVELIKSQIARQQKIIHSSKEEKTIDSKAVVVRDSDLEPEEPEMPQRNDNQQTELQNVSSNLDYKNVQMFLGVGITATILALTSSTYGLFKNWLSPSPTKKTAISNPAAKTLAKVANVPQGQFSYSGSTAFTPLRSPSVTVEISQAHPQFRLRYIQPVGKPPNSDTGIAMLLAGEVNFAQSSRPLVEGELTQAKQRGFTLEQVPVAMDTIVFFVSPRLAIPGLNLSQIKNIFTGKIGNWKAVGGPDLLITPVSLAQKAYESEDFVRDKVLAGEALGSDVQEVTTPRESIQKVARASGGIGYAAAPFVVGQGTVQPLPLSRSGEAFVSPFAKDKPNAVDQSASTSGSYPLTRQLFVVKKHDGGLDEKVGTAYVNLLLSNEGQRLIEQAGLIPIR